MDEEATCTIEEVEVSDTFKYRIAHLSDIHAGIGFDVNLWEYIKKIIIQARPNIIVITGDVVNSPWPLKLTQIRNELNNLSRSCGAKLIVVPGNHDMAMSGIYKIWPYSKFFRIIFYGDKENKLNRFQPLSKYYKNSIIKRIFQWMYFYSFFFVLWIIRKIKDEGINDTLPICYKSRESIIFCLDSNFKGDLATGYIQDKSIYKLNVEIEDIKQSRNPGLCFSPRIAVLHHHPLPIPYSNVKEGLTSYEPFLILRNAGTLLKELIKCDFDLILHGHKHFHNFSKISYGEQLDLESGIGVLSAGSSTIRYNEAGRNSINMIDIHPNGRISTVAYYFGGGQSLDKSDKNSSLPSNFVHSIPAHKIRNYKRAIALQMISCDTYEREIEIDKIGTAKILTKVKGFNVYGSYTTDERSFTFKSPGGFLHPQYGKMYDTKTSRGFTLIPFGHDQFEPSKSLKFTINFGRIINSGDKSIDYGLSMVAPNSFGQTAWECINILKDRNEEFSGIIIRYPCKLLRISIQLPAELENPSPYVTCEMPENYPNLEIQADNEIEAASVQKGQFIIDSEMTDFESPHLTKIGDIKWILEIEYPIVGFFYKIRWRVSEANEKIIKKSIIGETNYFTKVLKDYRLTRTHNIDNHAINVIRKALRSLLDHLTIKFKSRYDRDEITELGLYVLDEESGNIILIDSVSSISSEPNWNFSIPYGDGIRGATLKKRQPFIYEKTQFDTSGLFIFPGQIASLGMLDIDGNELVFDYQALVTVPIVYPDSIKKAIPSPGEVIGLMSFASNSTSSGILKLIESNDREQLREQLMDLSRLMNLICQAILGELIPDFKIVSKES
jgi:hypothetical protein